MKKLRFLLAIILCAAVLFQMLLVGPGIVAGALSADEVYLSDMDWVVADTPGYGSVSKDTTCDGLPVTIGGVSYSKAIGTHTINDIEVNQDIVYDISGLGFVYFSVLVGLQDSTEANLVHFSILVDGVLKAEHHAVGQQPAKPLGVFLEGAATLTLRVNCDVDGHGFDSCAWAMPVLSKSFSQSLYLSDIDWQSATPPGYGAVSKDMACDGTPAVIGGVTYQKAIGTHAINDPGVNQDIVYNIDGLGYSCFSTLVGIKDSGATNHVRFSVLVDGVVKADYTATGMQPAKLLVVPVAGAQTLTLRVNCAEDFYYSDNAIWANPKLNISFPDTLYLSDTDWQTATAPGWGAINKDLACDGNPVVIAGVPYSKAIGTHTIGDGAVNQDITYNIAGMGYRRFTTLVGLQDQNQTNRVTFSILVDGVVKATTTMQGMQSAEELSVLVNGAATLTLRVNCADDGNGFDNCVWAMPELLKVMPDNMYLSDLDWQSATPPGWGVVNKDMTCDGQPLIIGGVPYPKGIGTHAINDPAVNQDIVYNIAGMGYKTFVVKVGVKDAESVNAVSFSVLVDGVVKAQHTAAVNEAAKELFVIVENASTLTLRVNCTDDDFYDDNAIWAMPLLSVHYPDELFVSDIDWQAADGPGWGVIGRDKTCDGLTPVIANISYPKAIGTHALLEPQDNQDIQYNITGMGYTYFSALAGIQDQGQPNTVLFSILVDGVEKVSYTAQGGEKAKRLIVPVTNANTLTLRVNCSYDGQGYDNAVWAMPALTKNAEVPLWYGDINQDGAVTIVDLIAMKKHLAQVSELTGAKLQAAGIAHSGTVDAHDIVLLRKCLLGLINIDDCQNPTGLDEAQLYTLADTGGNVLESAEFGLNQGAPVQIAGSAGELNQFWQLTLASNGSFRIRNAANGRYLEADSTGNALVTNAFSAGSGQKWQISKGQNGTLTIASQASGKYITVSGTAAVLTGGSAEWTATAVGIAAISAPQLLPLSGKTAHSSTPEIVKYGDTYYSYIMAPGITIKASKDMLNWTPVGSAFPADNLPAWQETAIPGGEIWAPGVYQIGSTYYLYYCVSNSGSQLSAIGVATNTTLDHTSPAFEWVDKGPVITSQPGDDYNCIDPNIIMDENGTPWLVFGSHWNGIYMRKIDPATGLLDTGDTTAHHIADRSIGKGRAIEAPYMIKHGEYYYLFAAVDALGGQNYHMVVGRSESIMGPFVDKNGIPMLGGDGGTAVTQTKPGIKNPGHASIFKDSNGSLYVVSEYFPSSLTDPTRLLISSIVWDNEGWPVSALTPAIPDRLSP